MTDQATQLRSLVKQTREAPPAVSYGPICPSGYSAGAAPAHLRVKGRRSEGSSQRSEVRSQHTPVAAQSSVRSTQHSVLNTQPIARAIAVCSGKGGVGKSNLAVNLAASMSAWGLKVCLLDADLGLANADVLCNVSPRLTLQHVINERCRLADAMLLAPGGFRLIPGASGVARLADLPASARQSLLQQFAALEHVADVLLIDCGAGISANVIGFAAAADIALVIVTPEPTSLTDGYATVKSLAASKPAADIRVVVNMAANDNEAAITFERIDRVSRLFLNRPLRFGGMIPMDKAVATAVRQRIPFVLHSPDALATLAVQRIAAELAPHHDTWRANQEHLPPSIPFDETHSTGFFSRLAVWLGLAEYVE